MLKKQMLFTTVFFTSEDPAPVYLSALARMHLLQKYWSQYVFNAHLLFFHSVKQDHYAAHPVLSLAGQQLT